MSLKLPSASITPNPVYTGAQFIISVEVYDDEFEFSGETLEYNEYQGFADIDQTIGGKLIDINIVPGLYTINDERVVDVNGAYLIPFTGAQYTLDYTGEQIDQFISEVLNG